MKWYLKVLLENYANFGGRARRQEYWMFVLFQIIIIVLLSFLCDALYDFFNLDLFAILFGAFFIGTLIPWLAVNVRRLHDTGKSGGYIFINFIPLIGRIWYIILVATNGDFGPNQYGPDPKSYYSDEEIDEIGKTQID